MEVKASTRTLILIVGERDVILEFEWKTFHFMINLVRTSATSEKLEKKLISNSTPAQFVGELQQRLCVGKRAGASKNNFLLLFLSKLLLKVNFQFEFFSYFESAAFNAIHANCFVSKFIVEISLAGRWGGNKMFFLFSFQLFCKEVKFMFRSHLKINMLSKDSICARRVGGKQKKNEKNKSKHNMKKKLFPYQVFLLVAVLFLYLLDFNFFFALSVVCFCSPVELFLLSPFFHNFFTVRHTRPLLFVSHVE